MMKNKLGKVFKKWLPFAAVITIFSGLVFLAVQQNFRMNANDPQIQLAEDVADTISNGQSPESVAASIYPIDISKSLAPFVAIFDSNGKTLASSAQLDGKVPEIPGGVIDYVKKHGEDRITWQPRKGVRVAAVVTSFSGKDSSGKITNGEVLVGRSLKEVEKRETMLTIYVVVAWLVALIAVFVILMFTLPKAVQTEIISNEIKNEAKEDDSNI